MSEPEPSPNTAAESAQAAPVEQGGRVSLRTRLVAMATSVVKSKFRLALAVGIGLTLIAVGAGVGLWFFLRGSPDNSQAEQILSALKRGDYPLVRELTDKVLATEDVSPDQLRVALSARFFAVAREADAAKGEDRRRLLDVAINYGEQAASVGFTRGWEEEAAFLLGRCLHYRARFAESRKWLREAGKRTVDKQARVYWLLAESHLLDPQGIKEEALKFNEAFLQISRLDVQAKNAGWMQRAKIQIALGNPDDATSSLTKLSPQAAQSPEAQFLRGWIDYELGKRLLTSQEENKAGQDRLRSAAERLERVRRLVDADESLRSRATYLLGLVFEGLGEYDKAIAAWEGCHSEYPGTYEAWAARLRLAQLYQETSRYQQASEAFISCFREIVDSQEFFNPWVKWSEAQTLVRDALATYKEKQLYEIAMNVIDSLEKSFAEAEVHELRATVLSAWGETLLRQAQSESSDRQINITWAKRCFRLAGDEFTRLARTRSGTRFYTEDLWQAAEHYYRGGSYSRASRVYREYLRNEARRRNPIALLRLGECLLALGRVDEALLVLNECIEFHRKDAASYSARLLAAHAHMEKGSLDKAEEMLLANLSGELAPTSVEWRDSLFTLGEMYYQLRRDQDAIPRLEEAIRRYPEDPRSTKAKYYLAEIYSRLAWNRMMLSPSSSAATPDMATIRNDFLRSLHYYRQVQSDLDFQWTTEEPSEDTRKMLRNTYFAIGRVCYHLGQFAEAVAAFTTITNRFQAEPEVLDAYVEIARCRRAMGQNPDARIALEQAKIVLTRFPNEIPFERTTPFSRAEWATRLDKLLQTP